MLWLYAQNALTAAVLTLAVYALCRAFAFRPAVRHALWLIVLVKLVMPPMAVWPWNPWQPLLDRLPSLIPDFATNASTSTDSEFAIGVQSSDGAKESIRRAEVKEIKATPRGAAARWRARARRRNSQLDREYLWLPLGDRRHCHGVHSGHSACGACAGC